MKDFLSIAIILSNLLVLLANQRALKLSVSIGFVAFIKVKPRVHAHKKVFNSLDLHGTLKNYLTSFMWLDSAFVIKPYMLLHPHVVFVMNCYVAATLIRILICL